MAARKSVRFDNKRRKVENSLVSQSSSDRSDFVHVVNTNYVWAACEGTQP